MTLQPQQLIIGTTLAFILSATAWQLRLLTRSGAVAAWIVGAMMVSCGGWLSGGALLAFFATSNALGRFRRRAKEALGFEKGGRRDAGQVLANGGIAALFLLFSALLPSYHSALVAGSFAAIAEANADTWATEIGAAIGRSPRMLTSGKSVSIGTSGAVTAAGLIAALLGASLISIFSGKSLEALALVAGCGFAGSLFDSILGATAQAQYVTQDGRKSEKRELESRLYRGITFVNNDVVNALSTLFSALLALFISLHV